MSHISNHNISKAKEERSHPEVYGIPYLMINNNNNNKLKSDSFPN